LNDQFAFANPEVKFLSADVRFSLVLVIKTRTEPVSFWITKNQNGSDNVIKFVVPKTLKPKELRYEK